MRIAFKKVSVGRIIGVVLLLLLFLAALAALIALLSTKSPVPAIILISFATAFFLFLLIKIVKAGFKKKQRIKPPPPPKQPGKFNAGKLVGVFLLLLLLAIIIGLVALSASPINGLSLGAFIGLAALVFLVILILKSEFKQKSSSELR